MRQRPPICQRIAGLVRRVLDLPSKTELRAVRQQVHELGNIACLRARVRELELAYHRNPADHGIFERLIIVRQELLDLELAYGRPARGRA